MSIKRSFTVKITFKEGYGNPITLTGKDAVLVGDDNALNGADRIVDGIET